MTAQLATTAPPLPAAGASLRDFFARRFMPQCLAAANKNRIWFFRAAVNRFARFLQRPALVTDLTRENIAAFKTAAPALFIGPHLAKKTCSLLAGLATHAWRLGLLPAWTPYKFPAGLRVLEQRPDRRNTIPQLPPPLPGSVREFFETVYRPLKLLGAGQGRTVEYRHMLRQLYKFAGGDVLVSELTDRRAADFMEWALHGREAVTVNGFRARLFALWREAVTRGLLPRDPRVKKLREAVDLPDAWTEAETARLIDAPLSIEWRTSVAGIPQGKFWRALLLVAYWTALRRGSLLKLRRADVDLKSGWLTVPGNAMKGRKGKRLRLGPDALAALAEIWTPERELLLPWPIDLTEFHKRLRRIFRAAGLPPSTRKSHTGTHKMRRTVATLTAAKRGLAAASDLLGHSSTEVTKRYVDTSKLPGQDATEYLAILTQTAAPIGAGNPAGPTPDVAERSPAEWLQEAERLFRLGFINAAATTARVALEHGLLQWRAKVGVTSKRCKSVANVIYRLKTRGFMDEATAAELTRHATVANKAAHGKQIDAGKVAAMLLTVGDFLTRSFPSVVPLPQKALA